MEQFEDTIDDPIFIPILPEKGKRMSIMIATVMAGVILVVASISLSVETVGILLLKIFSILAGLAVIVLSILEFKKFGANRWIGTDMIFVLTGLLIIAQGAAAFQPLNDFQPAHFLFLAGAVFIFKGVMLPESKIKRGFMITDNEIIFNNSNSNNEKIVPFIDLKEITMVGDALVFNMKDLESVSVSLKGAANQEEIFESLTTVHKFGVESLPNNQ